MKLFMLYTFWKHYFNYTQRYKTTCFILCANPCRWDLWIPLILVRRRWSYPTVPGGIYKSHLGSQVGFINPTRDPAWETKCHVKCGIPGGIYFLSRVGLAGSHHSWRDPAIPTWDPRWDWWDPAWLFTWVWSTKMAWAIRFDCVRVVRIYSMYFIYHLSLC